MKLRVDPEARTAFRSMPPASKKRMRDALHRLLEDPSGRADGLDVRPLRIPGDPPLFRLRVGALRAVYLLRRDSLDVVRVFHRGDGYGWLERLYP